MKRSQRKQTGIAIAALVFSALITTPFAMADLVGGAVGGAGGAVGGVVNGAGGAVNGTVNGNVTSPLNGTVNGTVNGALNGNVNGSGASGNAGASSNVGGNGALGKALDASFAGSTNANASASVELPNSTKAIQDAFALMQKEKGTGKLVLAKAESIRGTVTDTADKYVTFVSDKGLTYVAMLKGAAKNTLHKGSHIIAKTVNYGQDVQLMIDSSTTASSTTNASANNSNTNSSFNTKNANNASGSQGAASHGQ